MTTPLPSDTRRKVHIWARAEHPDGPAGEMIWHCRTCGSTDFVPMPVRAQMRFHELVHCARCRPSLAGYSPLPYRAVPDPPLKTGIDRRTWKRWAFIFGSALAAALFILGMLRTWA